MKLTLPTDHEYCINWEFTLEMALLVEFSIFILFKKLEKKYKN